MSRYVAWRMLQLALAVFGITSVVFLLLRLSGDPVTLFVSDATTPEQREQIRKDLGFDRPLYVQYADFLKKSAVGDFGDGLRAGRPAMGLVVERLGASIELTMVGLILSIAIGVPIGVISAAKRGSWFDKCMMGMAVIGQGVPTFLLGIMLIWLFAVEWRMLPVGGRGTLYHLVLPAFTLATYNFARLARLSRSAVLEVLHQDFIRTARAKGLHEHVVLYKHALKNASLTIITAIGVSFSAFFGGAVITETIFSWPGIGRLLVQAVGQRDYPVAQAAVFVTAIFVTVVNLMTDLTYAQVDPRIRYT